MYKNPPLPVLLKLYKLTKHILIVKIDKNFINLKLLKKNIVEK